MLRARSQRGVSMIEIAIVLAIIGIGMSWAMPSYSKWMQNAQIRNMAEMIIGGVQQARSEAISRSGNVEFLLTSLNPTSADKQALIPALADANGVNWMIRAANLPGAPTPYTYVAGSVGTEGSSKATVQAGDINISGNLNAVTFDGFGRVVAANADASLPITKICVASSALTAANGAKVLEIDVSAGGQVKMCDPSVTAGTDPRRCLTAAPRCA